MEFQTHTLANGLEILAECNGDAHSAALGFFVKTGARDETDAVSGVSHFLEHMVFKGTPRRSADDVNREFDEMGAHYNAFTSEENTVYYAAVLPEFQTDAVDLLADILRPALRKKDFDTEKNVILEEIKMYEDQPPFGADDKCRAAHYGAHPLGKSVLGSPASIRDLAVEQMRDYFRTRYSPKNIVLAAAGRIDFDRLVQETSRRCGDWEPFPAPREMPPVPTAGSFHVVTKESAAQEYMIQLSNGPGATDADRHAAKLLATVLGDDSGSRLYWELVDSGRAEQCSLGHYDYQGTGIFMTYTCCDPEGTADNLQAIRNLFRAAEREGITAAELALAKSKINSRVVLSSEKPRSRLFNVGFNWICRHEYRTIRDDLDAIDSVTVAQANAVLKKYPLTQNTTYAVGPLAAVAAPK
ncbi:MAG TPA: pitrilysin family protein [Pirellulales bacterium]|jgi:predicted Zn-dependent peptidase|nr:pitrilysin family protein [Pirellulales bacterium]